MFLVISQMNNYGIYYYSKYIGKNYTIVEITEQEKNSIILGAEKYINIDLNLMEYDFVILDNNLNKYLLDKHIDINNDYDAECYTCSSRYSYINIINNEDDLNKYTEYTLHYRISKNEVIDRNNIIYKDEDEENGEWVIKDMIKRAERNKKFYH